MKSFCFVIKNGIWPLIGSNARYYIKWKIIINDTLNRGLNHFNRFAFKYTFSSLILLVTNKSLMLLLPARSLTFSLHFQQIFARCFRTHVCSFCKKRKRFSAMSLLVLPSPKIEYRDLVQCYSNNLKT